MPACAPRCPIVIDELKKIVRSEAPWLWERENSSKIGVVVKGREARPFVDDRLPPGYVELKRGADAEEKPGGPSSSPSSSPVDQHVDDSRGGAFEETVVTERLADASKLATDSARRIEREEDGTASPVASSGTRPVETREIYGSRQADSSKFATDPARRIETEEHGEASPVGSSGTRPAETREIYGSRQADGASRSNGASEHLGTAQDVESVREVGTQDVKSIRDVGTVRDDESIRDVETVRDVGTVPDETRRTEEANLVTAKQRGSVAPSRIASASKSLETRRDVDRADTSDSRVRGKRTESTKFQEKCQPNCPRRISRRNRLRKREERQRIVDAYLLNKGANYFDDVCTCSLSCVVRALRDDPFVRSIFASGALFALGLKLSSELDAWYLPVPLR